MKKFIATLLIVGLFIGGFAFAKECPKTEKRKPTARSVRPSHRGHSSFFGLKLTDDQKEKLAAIRKETAEKIKKIVEESKAKAKEVLTKEQVKKLEDMKKKFEARRAEFKKRFEAHKKRFEGKKKGEKPVERPEKKERHRRGRGRH